MILSKQDLEKTAELLLQGKIGVIPSDTIYGLHCLEGKSALYNKITELKGIDKNTPLITLISKVQDLTKFPIVINNFVKENIAKYWPGPNTLIFDLVGGGTKSFRLPADKYLIDLINRTGPLISTSANKHGQPPALTTDDAKQYFGDQVDFYVDIGYLNNPPSSVYKLTEGLVAKIR